MQLVDQTLYKQSRRRLLAFRDSCNPWAVAVAITAFGAVTYFLVARMGLTLLKPGGVAVIWPALGLAVGALIALGSGVRVPVAVGIFVGMVAARLMVAGNVWLAIALGLCNTGGGLLTASLIERWFGPAFKLENVSSVLGFLGATVVGTFAAALGGSAVVTIAQPTASILDVWRDWFTSAALGIVTVAPVPIGLASAMREALPRREQIEGAVALAILGTVSAFVISLPPGPWATAVPVALVLPLVLSIAVRCRPVFAAAAAFMVALAVVCSTSLGLGHFSDPSIPVANRTLAAQAIVLAGALCVLILSALFAERREHETALADRNQRLQLLLAEREEAGRALAERDAQLALAGKIARVGNFTFDIASGTMQISPGYAAIHGLPEGTSETTRSQWRTRVRPDDLPRLDANLQRDIDAGRSEHYCEYRITRSTGVMRWIEARSFISYDREGAALRIIGANIDVTERKEAELTLAERNMQLALAGKAALVGSYVYDGDMQRMKVSEGYAAMHGLPEGTTETTRRQWRTRVHPNDIAQLEGLRAQTFGDRQGVYNVDYRIVRGGEVRWIEARSFISYDSGGRPQRIIGVNIDVTERKRTEALLNESKARLTDALVAGQVIAFEWDAAGCRSQRSDNADPIFGCAQGNTFLRQVHPDDRARLKRQIRALNPANPSYALSFRFARPDGSQVWLEESAKGEFDCTGKLLRIKGLTQDITERKELENHKNTLISELDHRVKNVLAIVSAVASRTQETSSSMAEFVAALDGRIKSMATTHELLSSRHWQGIPLAELVRGELAPYTTTSNTRIDGPDVVLSAEAGQTLAMLFHELATNAAKFGALSAKSGRVSVRWNLRRNGNRESCLSIQWGENGGPHVVPPTRSGFGTSVVRELIPYELGGIVDLEHAREGVRCRVEIPGSWLSARLTKPPVLLEALH
jgi:PAS domain S-box-containing protein